MASSSSTGVASFSANVVLGRSLAHRASLQLLASPAPAHQAALPLFVQAAQAFALAVRQAPSAADKAAVQRDFKAALEKAEACKNVLRARETEGGVRRHAGKGRCDPESQQIVLLQSGSVDTAWGKLGLPLASPFLPLSPALPNPALPVWSDGSYAAPPSAPLWCTGERPESIQQDRIGNCSFVASVQVAVAWNARHGQAKGRDLLEPLLAPSTADPNIYRLSLHLNGARRTVHVDALLPVTSTSAPLGVSSDGEDAPARAGAGWGIKLLEKGWMALRGGWDAVGSNSSVDLHALTGWVPEVLNLRDSEFKREQTWTRLHSTSAQGLCLMTLGTGRLTKAQIRDTGLISRHDYSVLDLVESDGKRLVKILNPWKRKARLKTDGSALGASTATGRLDVIPEETGWSADLRSALEVVGDERVFSMPWEVVVQVFDAVYLNWDPRMFGSSASVHSIWPARATSSSSAPAPGLASQSQFELRSREARPIWLHLTRHLSRIRPPSDDSERLFIGMRVFEADGGLGGALSESTVFTDSSHHLVKIVPTRPNSTFTIILPREGAGAGDGRFTLTAHAAGKDVLSLADPPPDLPYAVRADGAFSGRTAGGSPAFPSFMDNPMHKLVVRPPAPGAVSTAEVRAMLTVKAPPAKNAPKSSFGVNVKLVWSKGERITQLVASDVVVDSGGYQREMTLCSKAGLQPGTYTLVVSTHASRQECEYELELQSTTSIVLKPIPQEGAGLFSRTVSGSWSPSTSFGSPTFGKYWRNPTYSLRLHKDADVILRLCSTSKTGSSEPPPPVPLNITVFAAPTSAGEPLGAEVVSSGPYTDDVCGAAIARRRLPRGEYRVVWSTYAPGVEGGFVVRVYSDGAFDWERRA